LGTGQSVFRGDGAPAVSRTAGNALVTAGQTKRGSVMTQYNVAQIRSAWRAEYRGQSQRRPSCDRPTQEAAARCFRTMMQRRRKGASHA
jgi:hypothetical protein